MPEVPFSLVAAHGCGKYEVIMKRKGKTGAIRVLTYADDKYLPGFQMVVRCQNAGRDMNAGERIYKDEINRVRAIVEAERANA